MTVPSTTNSRALAPSCANSSPEASMSSASQPVVHGAATSEPSGFSSSTMWAFGSRAMVSGFMVGVTPLMGRMSMRHVFCRISMREAVLCTSAMK